MHKKLALRTQGRVDDAAAWRKKAREDIVANKAIATRVENIERLLGLRE